MESSYLSHQLSAQRLAEPAGNQINQMNYVTTTSFGPNDVTQQVVYTGHSTQPVYTLTEPSKAMSHLPYQYGTYNYYGRDGYNPPPFDEPYAASAVDLTNLQAPVTSLSLNEDMAAVSNCSEINLSLKDLQNEPQNLVTLGINGVSRLDQTPIQPTTEDCRAGNHGTSIDPIYTYTKQPVINVPCFSSNKQSEVLIGMNLSSTAPENVKDYIPDSVNTLHHGSSQTIVNGYYDTDFENCIEKITEDVKYTCGGCFLKLPTVCLLHSHMKGHGTNCSYFYSSSTNTAYPRFETCSKDTQTEDKEETTEHHPKLRTKRNRKKAFVDDTADVDINAQDKSYAKNELEKSDHSLDRVSPISGSILGDKDDSRVKTRLADIEVVDCERKSKVEWNSAKKKSLIEEDETVENDHVENPSSDTDEYIPDSDLEKLKSVRKRKNPAHSLRSKNVPIKRKKQVIEKKLKPFKLKYKSKPQKAIVKHKKKRNSQIATDVAIDLKIKRTDKVGQKIGKENSKKDNVDSRVIKQTIKVQEKIECHLCDIAFTRRSNLRVHIKTKHADLPHICTLCSESCDSNEDLMKHKKAVHHRGNHQCDLCGKILSTKGMLEGHYLIHKGIKPFSCTVCVPKREFTRKCQLKAHMETHLEEKNLQCEFCGKPFNARYLMMNHVKHCSGRH